MRKLSEYPTKKGICIDLKTYLFSSLLYSGDDS